MPPTSIFNDEPWPASILGTGSSVGEDLQDEADSSEQLAITAKENKQVFRSKILVLVVIAVCAISFGTMAYFIQKNNEEEDFQQAFEDYAKQVRDLSGIEAKSMVRSISAFSNTWTSFALDTSSSENSTSWPFFTMPHFEHRGLKVNELASTIQISLVPLLKSGLKRDWEFYSQNNQGWVQDGVFLSSQLHRGFSVDELSGLPILPIPSSLYLLDSTGEPVPQDSPGVDFGPGNYGPIWQQVPAPHDPSIVNYDILSHPVLKNVYHGMWQANQPVFSQVTDLKLLYQGALGAALQESPQSCLMQPVYASFNETQMDREGIVGIAIAVIDWKRYFRSLVLQGIHGIYVVLRNTCGQVFTFMINDPDVLYLGEGDLHNLHYNGIVVTAPFALFLDHDYAATTDHCGYELIIYPSSYLENEYTTTLPYIYAGVVLFVFILMAGVFVGYDYMVQRQQKRAETEAKRTNALVSSLFPSTVRDRLLQEVEQQVENEQNGGKKLKFRHAKSELKSFLDEDKNAFCSIDTKPIADLFPHATIMFADIVGFTAWSSVREPSQVFTLLETLYHAFDEIARARRVFKVETVGDCYVAVAGVPDPRDDHAVAMARFANDCRNQMNILTKHLEVQLGPDTGDLSMRIGLHSGPVTAGVLRGDKSRFQLFGATVNTAAKIENLGERDRIHLSAETAELLEAAGKGHWIKKREDLVQTKGKGSIQTYWLLTQFQLTENEAEGGNGEEEARAVETAAIPTRKVEVRAARDSTKKVAIDDNKVQRLVSWNADVLGRLLKQIVACRGAMEEVEKAKGGSSNFLSVAPRNRQVIEEVREIISLPQFDKVAAERQLQVEYIQLDDKIQEQLSTFVSEIAASYRDNSFHSFEHASHVTMSVVKLLSRIVAPEVVLMRSMPERGEEIASTLHDHTYGITSDPLTQFACVFAALIHDVDHLGVPNAQLVNEGTQLARLYNNKSVAEQHSVNLAWDLLMQDQFADLRKCICATDEEMIRFRQLVVNSVMATDIMDKDLKTLRNARWEKAFSEQKENTVESQLDQVNRKATIVIEHLIQASDVAHTMQHWHIYRKWNERLFHEMYDAYKKGRAEKDPSEFWYTGEIGFFDFYIIPLAKKLKDCGVFGVSSDEYLNYAEKNRKEWEAKGKEIVESMAEKYFGMYGHSQWMEVEADDLQAKDNGDVVRSLAVCTGQLDESTRLVELNPDRETHKRPSDPK